MVTEVDQIMSKLPDVTRSQHERTVDILRCQKLHHAFLYSPAAEHHRLLAGTHFTVQRRIEGRVYLGFEVVVIYVSIFL